MVELVDFQAADATFLLVLRAALIRMRRASLTDSASGKAAATSGARVTMTVSGRKRLAYFPRMPLEKSYSGRISSSVLIACLDALLILPPFFRFCFAGANDADSLVIVSVYYEQQKLTY